MDEMRNDQNADYRQAKADLEFELGVISPAPRGHPQIEVTREIIPMAL